MTVVRGGGAAGTLGRRCRQSLRSVDGGVGARLPPDALMEMRITDGSTPLEAAARLCARPGALGGRAGTRPCVRVAAGASLPSKRRAAKASPRAELAHTSASARALCPLFDTGILRGQGPPSLATYTRLYTKPGPPLSPCVNPRPCTHPPTHWPPAPPPPPPPTHACMHAPPHPTHTTARPLALHSSHH